LSKNQYTNIVTLYKAKYKANAVQSGGF